MLDGDTINANLAKNLGSTSWNGLCQSFAEQMTGSGWQGASAIDAWNNHADSRVSGTLDGAGTHDLVYFSPDSSNRGYGHVGVMVSPDSMVSATDTGVKQFNVADWVKMTGQRLLGYVPSGEIPTGKPGGDVSEGLGKNNPDWSGVSQVPQAGAGQTPSWGMPTNDFAADYTLQATQKFLSNKSTDVFSGLDSLRQATIDDVLYAVGAKPAPSAQHDYSPVQSQQDTNWAQSVADENTQFTTTMLNELWRNSGGGAKLSDPTGQSMSNYAADKVTPMAGNPWAQKAAKYGYEAFQKYMTPDMAQALTPIFVNQIYNESGFSPDVIYGQRTSRAGAQGIAQIMPQFHPDVNPLDPDQALQYAATLMGRSYAAYGGNAAKALAAYNSGAGTVNQAVEKGGQGWIQYLPNETQQYLSNILGIDNASR